jgi:hypothetical protein
LTKATTPSAIREILDGSGFHFVGSLVPTHFADLLAIPLEKFRTLQDPLLESARALRLTCKVWGQERTLVITFSPELQRKQIRGIEQHLSKKRRALEELQAKLRRSQKGCGSHAGQIFENLIEQAVGGCPKRGMCDA